jgi:alpha-beta hydrolase superfamily lysophospholipase
MTIDRQGQLRTPDGFTLATASWTPPRPRALILYAHGHAEHLGRHQHVIDALVERGYAVSGQDHRGHGRSSGTRALVHRFDQFVDDFRLLAARETAAHPGLPVVALGHSMGGLIAARYALAHGDDLAALVTSGAAFISDDGVPRWQSALARLVARVWATAPVPLSQEDKLSHDPAVFARFRADPLCHQGPARARTAVELVDAGRDALARAPGLRLPYLGMHGEDDTLTSPHGTRQFLAAASSHDKTLTLWPGMKHEIFNERDGHRVIAHLLDWLDHRFPPPPGLETHPHP